MEQKMENYMETLGLSERVITPAIKNQMERKKDNYAEAGVMQGLQGLEHQV